jgi:hypothetical protein
MEAVIRSKSFILMVVLILALSQIALAGLTFTAGQGIALTPGQGVVLTGADGVVLTGADAITYASSDGVVLTGADSTGLRSFDPELALIMEQMPDSSAINVFVIFHRMPTEEDLNYLRTMGIMGGTRFRNLPILLINATKDQIATISRLASVRSINKTLEFFTHDTRIISRGRRLRALPPNPGRTRRKHRLGSRQRRERCGGCRPCQHPGEHSSGLFDQLHDGLWHKLRRAARFGHNSAHARSQSAVDARSDKGHIDARLFTL